MELMYDIIRYVQSFSHPFLDQFFIIVTMLGEDTIFILAAAFIFWCVDKEFGYKVGFASLTSGVLNTALKAIFKVPRPIGQPGIRSLRVETAGGYSFPSGHTQQATAFLVTLMLRLRKWWLLILGSIIILLVGLSRIYLGVHTPLDVLGGILIAIFWAYAFNLLFNRAYKEKNPFLLLVVIIPALIGALLYNNATYFKASGALFGLWLGFVIEFKYVNYQVKAVPLKQVLKYIIGMAGLFIIKTFLKPLLPDAPFSDFIRYGLLGIWLAVLAPLLFRYTSLEEK